jgi:hypothetical protein
VNWSIGQGHFERIGYWNRDPDSALRRFPTDQLAIEGCAGQPNVQLGDLDIPARPEFVKLLNGMLAPDDYVPETGEEPQEEVVRSGPLVLETVDNFEEQLWSESIRPRLAHAPREISELIRTSLKAHQKESFQWQVSAWEAGLPGILNADEQGLGKTLQTITFLTWLKENTANRQSAQRGPILIVAPTSLLENWEQEVSQHVDEPGLGQPIPSSSRVDRRTLTKGPTQLNEHTR